MVECKQKANKMQTNTYQIVNKQMNKISNKHLKNNKQTADQ